MMIVSMCPDGVVIPPEGIFPETPGGAGGVDSPPDPVGRPALPGERSVSCWLCGVEDSQVGVEEVLVGMVFLGPGRSSSPARVGEPRGSLFFTA